MRTLLTSTVAAGYVRVDETLVTLILLGTALGVVLLVWAAWKLWTAGARPVRDLLVYAALLAVGAPLLAASFQETAALLWLAVPVLGMATALGWRVVRAGSPGQGRAAAVLAAAAVLGLVATAVGEAQERAQREAESRAFDDRWPVPLEPEATQDQDGDTQP
jgi:hypothetical protein